MNTMLKGAFCASLITGSALLTSCGEKTTTPADANAADANQSANGEKKTLVITAIPDKKSSDQSVKYKALSDYLAKKLDINVKYKSSNSYSASVQAFTQGEAHLVWFGGLTGVQARAKVPGAKAIAQGKVDPKYKSYFIAHKDTGLEKSATFPKEIADMTFTFGSKSSTSGRLMPTYFIINETGKKPEDFFSKQPQFTGKLSHAGTAKAVHSGAVQVGALSYKTYDKMVKKGEIDPTVAKIIWETPGYPDYNFTAHPEIEKIFGEGFTDKLQKVLVECEDPAVLEVLMRKEGMMKASNDDFKKIVDVATQLGFLK